MTTYNWSTLTTWGALKVWWQPNQPARSVGTSTPAAAASVSGAPAVAATVSATPAAPRATGG